MNGRHPLIAALAARPPWQPGRLTRSMARVSAGVRTVSATIDPIEQRWRDLTADALDRALGSGETPSLWVVLGDSTAQGVGASSFDHGWVPRLHAALANDGRPHAVVNLSRSGSESSNVIDEQLPLLDLLPYEPSIVTVCVGSNDLMRNPQPAGLARRLRQLAAAAPAASVLCTLPAPAISLTARYVNRAIRAGAAEHGHTVAELTANMVSPRKGLAGDRYHPNDRGYGAWVRAFAPPMGLDPASVPDRGALTST